MTDIDSRKICFLTGDGYMRSLFPRPWFSVHRMSYTLRFYSCRAESQGFTFLRQVARMQLCAGSSSYHKNRQGRMTLPIRENSYSLQTKSPDQKYCHCRTANSSIRTVHQGTATTAFCNSLLVQLFNPGRKPIIYRHIGKDTSSWRWYVIAAMDGPEEKYSHRCL